MTDKQAYEALYGDLVNWVEHYKVKDSGMETFSKQVESRFSRIINDKFWDLQ